MKIGLIVASYGRPELIRELLTFVGRQVRSPDSIILSVVSDKDVGPLPADPRIDIVYSAPGLCAQRNTGLARLQNVSDVVVFIDDDFWMSDTYLRELERIFSDHPDVVAVTGLILADGATTAGISIADAEQCLADYARSPAPAIVMRDVPDTYGCNMAYRSSKIGTLRFDERLPLYGWQEDVDFSAQLRGRGRIIWTNAVWGVHLGTKKGKISGVRFGYSQVVNPIFIFKKGNMSLKRAAVLICKNIIANAGRSLFPESYIDRVGRLKGNMIGLLHVVLGRLDPMHALKL
jgi:GT2 family glycosyltransferase